MTGELIHIEELEGGAKAAFVNLPHFRTSAVRIGFNAGWLHEDGESMGSAHFLEHISFQGTEQFACEEELEDYSGENGIQKNAHTNMLNTTFEASAHDLSPALKVASQLAFYPTLTAEVLENERKPILDEARRFRSNPNYLPSVAHRRAQAGEIYARDGLGSEVDINNMTHESLKKFYDRQYKLANALIVVCSGESVEVQRQMVAECLPSRFRDTESSPKLLNLPWFKAQPEITSLQQIALPHEASTSIDLQFVQPTVNTVYEMFMLNVSALALSQAANNRIRRELNLSYGAGANPLTLTNLNFGANESYSEISIGTQLAGEDVIEALDALKNDVLDRKIPESVIRFAFKNTSQIMDNVLENNPYSMASAVMGALQSHKYDDVIDTSYGSRFVQITSVEDIQNYIYDATRSTPLVVATSPNSRVLENIAHWAAKNY